jgi:HEAT repeat protein
MLLARGLVSGVGQGRPKGEPPVRALAFPIAIVCLVFGIAADAQTTKSKQKKKEDLPDVSLQIPDETRPEVKAIIKDNVIALSSSKPSDRIKAAHVLGELGEQGKPVRRLLCRAMLDNFTGVRVAAADALKNIDPKIQYLAVSYVSEKSESIRGDLLRKIEALKEDGEPLTPLVEKSAKMSAQAPHVGLLAQEITTLGAIAKNDLSTAKLIISALNNTDRSVRHSSLQVLGGMKHGRLATSKIMKLIKTDYPDNRIAGIRALADLVDPSNEEIVTDAIAGQRYHEEESVRKAVEEALNKIQNKRNP